MILLYCANTPGQVAFPVRRVDGRDAPACQYDIIDHLVAIDAGDDIVTAHDAEELCRHHGFRLATAAEQEAYTARLREGGALAERLETEHNESDAAVEEPKAAARKAKNSGGKSAGGE